MNNSERNSLLDEAWKRTAIQHKVLELHKSQGIISDDEYETRFSEINTHYRDSINSIERTHRQVFVIKSSNP